MKLLSIVFSFRNEEGNIKELVERINKSLNILKDWSYEIIFVNDDSTDNSETILLDLQKSNPIKIINMSRNFGIDSNNYGRFIAVGTLIVYLHTDLQDPPEIIPKLIKKFEEGNDVVHTVRSKRHGEV